MIPDIFINSAAYLLNILVYGLLPASTGFPDEFVSAFSTIGGYIDILSPVVPWSTMATCVALVYSVELGMFAFRSLKWILGFIPFIGSRV